MILKEVGQLTASRPNLSNVGFQLNQFLLHGLELFVAQIVELGGIRFVVAENLRLPYRRWKDRPIRRFFPCTSDPTEPTKNPAAEDTRSRTRRCPSQQRSRYRSRTTGASDRPPGSLGPVAYLVPGRPPDPGRGLRVGGIARAHGHLFATTVAFPFACKRSEMPYRRP